DPAQPRPAAAAGQDDPDGGRGDRDRPNPVRLPAPAEVLHEGRPLGRDQRMRRESMRMYSRRAVLGTGVLALGGVLAACSAPEPTATAKPAAPTQAPAA